MKFIIVLAALVAIAVAAPATPDSEAQTIVLNIDNDPLGQYKVEYVSKNYRSTEKEMHDFTF